MNKIIPFLNTWLSKSGDDTFWSWVITLIYLLTIILSLYYVHNIKTEKTKHFLWISISIFLMALGINKQLDIQILVEMVGRFIAKNLGLLQHRYFIHFIFAFSLFVIMIAISIFVLIRIRTIIGQSLIALSGVTLLTLFVFIRAGSIYVPRIHGLELLGLMIIFADLSYRLYKSKKISLSTEP